MCVVVVGGVVCVIGFVFGSVMLCLVLVLNRCRVFLLKWNVIMVFGVGVIGVGMRVVYGWLC